MAVLAVSISLNCTKAQFLLLRCFRETSSPKRLNISRSSCSVARSDNPPMNSVVFPGLSWLVPALQSFCEGQVFFSSIAAYNTFCSGGTIEGRGYKKWTHTSAWAWYVMFVSNCKQVAPISNLRWSRNSSLFKYLLLKVKSRQGRLTMDSEELYTAAEVDHTWQQAVNLVNSLSSALRFSEGMTLNFSAKSPLQVLCRWTEAYTIRLVDWNIL